MRLRALAAIVAILAALMLARLVAADDLGEPLPPDIVSSVQPEAAHVEQLVNAERAAYGLPALQISHGLELAALEYAAAEVSARCYGHRCPGSDPDRLN